MKSALALTLAFIFGIALTASSLGIIAMVQIESHNNQLSDTLIDHAFSTCQYGSEMFYVARGIDVLEANYLALSDCENYLESNGEEWFIDFYGLQ